MNSTKIEWTEATWNPSIGCTKVIVGGESGPKARPMKAEWVENIQKQ